MRFFVRLVMCFLAAGFSLGVVADDWEDCENYSLAEYYKRVCRAAKQGDVGAQFGLGWMYAKGEVVPKNDREAVKWFRLAAEQGFAPAQSSLGSMYAKGEGVSEDDREAIKWYRLAAEQESAIAQYNLGLMYANGEGVTQDQQEAYIWFSLAAVNGNKDASKSRDRTAKYLTVSELQIAQQEAQRRFAERRQEEEEKRKEEERKHQEESRLAEEKRLADETATNALANLRDRYIRRIIRRIEPYLITPPSAKGINYLVVVVRVRLHSDGTLVDSPEVVESSGLPEYDKAAIRAIIKATPLPMPTKEPELMAKFKELNLYIRPR